MAADALIFDLDGTIWDSYPAYARVLGDGGIGRAETRLEELRAGQSVVVLARKYGGEARFIRRLLQDSAGPTLYPKAARTLAALHGNGRGLGIVTSLPGRLAEPLLDRAGLSTQFDVVVHRGNCRAAKPNPRPLLQAIQSLGCSPGSVCYIGDTETDAQCAAAASVTFAWASYGYGNRRPSGTSVVLNAFEDVARL